MTENEGVNLPWDPLSPRQVGELLADFPRRWWLAGGWAIDLFIGQQTRPHADIDVEISRADIQALAQLLKGWDLQLASGGVLTPWDAASPVPEKVNSLWCRPAGAGPWRMQVMLGVTRGDRWFYRRDERLSRCIDQAVLRTTTGLPYLAPEIQLLYKSVTPRPKDLTDLHNTLGKLDTEQLEWLTAALGITAGAHPWLRIIDNRENEVKPATAPGVARLAPPQ